ncbi:hypothetical protein [Jeotgalibacillus salarius]|uniref:HNH endonuclease n=1 Tax=Jeotgalibacillus salarius TaxID=546023 RepID=A0A4Y8LDN3_9BACL|nr:hypothetical protein [Jeotgalibacillus salarius]TFD99602.1 hypothetical protein E2626_13890 [Jeotgalibacillus salarius]
MAMRKRIELINIDGACHKECTKCGSIKKLEEYSNDKKGKLGKQSACKVCRAKDNKEYLKNNAEKVAATKKRYREENKEAFKERDCRYREANKDRIREYMRQYQQLNAEAIRERKSRWHFENKDDQNGKARHYYSKHAGKIRERNKQYYLENIDVIKERNKKYIVKNTQVIAERKRLYAKKNTEAIAAYKKKWQEDNGQRIREQRKQFRQENADKIKESKRKYYKENPHIKVASGQRRRARLKKLPSDLATAQAFEILNLFNGCAISNLDEGTHLDHFICLDTGHGGTTLNNMLPMASSLNISKNHYNPFEWVQNKDVAAQLDIKKWHTALKYLAELNEMTVKEYRDYVNYCYTHPRDLSEESYKEDEDRVT